MPRKPNLPRELVIQGLSDGQVVTKVMLDDFTGQPITPRITQPPKRELAGIWELQQARQRAATASARALVEHLFAPKLVAKHIPGKRVFGVLNTKDGPVAMYKPKDWRRI